MSIIVKGKEFSEETVEKALRAYCDFESDVYNEPANWKAGDVLSSKFGIKSRRIVIKDTKGELIIADESGYVLPAATHALSRCNWDYFKEWEYTKLGRITDFIK